MSFPAAVWGSRDHVLTKRLIAFSGTTAGSWMIRKLVPLDLWLYRRTGRYTVLGPFGVPIMLLTTTGAKSGLARTTPLLYDRVDDDLVVIASNFGQAHHPAWSGNLIADPQAVVTIGGEVVPVVAELLTGDEAQAAFRHMADDLSTYDAYRTRTDREIRVFRLRASA